MEMARKSLTEKSPRIAIRGLLFTCLLAVEGCTRPDAANITLRKENQKLEARITELERANAGFIAPTTRETQPTINLTDRQYGSLFVTSNLQLGKLTGEDEGMLKVYAVPVDQDGDQIKAAGSFSVDAFDLSDSGKRIAPRDFPPSDSHKNWYGSALLRTYVLKCPWQTPPNHKQVTLKVTFTDELTGRIFTQQKVIDANAGGKSSKEVS